MSSCRAYDQWERRMANDEGEAPLTPEQKAAIMQKLTERSAAGGGASLTAELLGEIEDCMDALDGPGAQDDDQEVEGEPNNGIPSAAMKRLKELDVRSASDQAEAAELIEHLQQHGELKQALTQAQIDAVLKQLDGVLSDKKLARARDALAPMLNHAGGEIVGDDPLPFSGQPETGGSMLNNRLASARMQTGPHGERLGDRDPTNPAPLNKHPVDPQRTNKGGTVGDAALPSRRARSRTMTTAERTQFDAMFPEVARIGVR